MSQNTKIPVWKVRGLNSLAKRAAVLQVVLGCAPSIVCFQETKLEVVDQIVVIDCLGNNFNDFAYLPAAGTRGGILVAWNSLRVNLSNAHFADHSITLYVDSSEGNWWITSVYGPHRHQDRPSFFQELRDVRDLHAGPWAIMGDFNAIVNAADKSNARLHRASMSRFRSVDIFEAATSALALDGNTTAFWTDPWFFCSRFKDLAPNIFAAAHRGERRLSVKDALIDNRWARFLNLDTVANHWQEFLLMWDCVNNVVLPGERGDLFFWNWSASGRYSTKSAYGAFFGGREVMPGYDLI
ncbi:hypothetical protein BRADI_4g27245v3 [Brachypodium distachyon]|uniref:Endonuclease/exonuclease/phosphatase domain-containing protein n=1 Tax=Brachypodium distachyon TaxID=15368 RepID=A0A2K2CQI8_BRADI|nr:hypothetical protein BRADI_4g27245v3 [Brachypodium distachyon]